MSNVTGADVRRMEDSLFLPGSMRSAPLSRFWVLLILAAIIATAGVLADSTATVIGAMIVAPLMTPILGTALAVVLSNRTHLVRSVLLVITGALAVVLVAYLIGSLGQNLDDYSNNSQVNARIHPGLIDLMAALATGTVGAFALVRSDVSDTLPGVAIAISLVPPLAVVGLLLQVGRYEAAGGALLLFATNFAAIVATGTAVLLAYRVREAAESAGIYVGALTGRTLLTVALGVVIVAIPLGIGSYSVARDEMIAYQARPIAADWAARANWQVSDLTVRSGSAIITALGPPPKLDSAGLRREFDAAGLEDVDLQLRLVVGGVEKCEAGTDDCVRAPGLVD